MKFAYSNRSPKQDWSWEKLSPDTLPPLPPPAEVIEADVAVVGGGIAGLAVGTRCAELGLSVVVLEKGAEPYAGGKYIGVVPEGTDKKIFAKRWLRATGSRVSEPLLWRYIDRSAAALDWLVSLSEGKAAAVKNENIFINPETGAIPGDYFLRSTDGNPAEGGALAVQILENALVRFGGKYCKETSCLSVRRGEDGRINTILAMGGGKILHYIGKKAVILATGDCGGDEEMLSACSPLSLRAAKTLSPNTGDGQRMAYWAGAELDGRYWAPHFGCGAYAPYSFFFTSVNRDGKRFMNEDTHEVAKARHCINQRDGEFAFTICDDKWFDELNAARGIAGGPTIMPDAGLTRADIEAECGENIFCADTLDELAAKIGVPADALKATAARVNELAAKGEDVDYGKRPELLTTIEKAPFYAFKWGNELIATLGGAVVDEDMRVLDPDDWPIPGLYAVGACAGGFFAVGYPSILAGSDLGSAITFSKMAAESIQKLEN